MASVCEENGQTIVGPDGTRYRVVECDRTTASGDGEVQTVVIYLSASTEMSLDVETIIRVKCVDAKSLEFNNKKPEQPWWKRFDSRSRS